MRANDLSAIQPFNHTAVPPSLSVLLEFSHPDYFPFLFGLNAEEINARWYTGGQFQINDRPGPVHDFGTFHKGSALYILKQ